MNMRYLDWAATAPPDPEIVQWVAEISQRVFGNPSSPHPLGKAAEAELSRARNSIAEMLGLDTRQIVFTSGGTESNSIVLGSLLGRTHAGLVTTAIEHGSVYEPARRLSRLGAQVKLLEADETGLLRPGQAAEAVDEGTAIVSVMAVNNETGAIQPVREIVAAVRDRSARLGRPMHVHTDAVQALGKLPLRFNDLDVDSASASAHKISGPRGVGLLYLRKPIESPSVGGGQEFGMRSGTENVAGNAGLAEALRRRLTTMDADLPHARSLTHTILQELVGFEGCVVNPEYRLEAPEVFSPYIVNLAFPPVPGEVLVRVLGDRGFAVSTGSACSTRRKTRTRVLEASGVSPERAASSLRVSVGPGTTLDEVQELCAAVKQELPLLLKVAR